MIDVDFVPPALLTAVPAIADEAIAKGLADGYRLRAALRIRRKQLAGRRAT